MDSANTIPPGQLYYLPPRESGLEVQWAQFGRSQPVYAKLCESADTIIANEIIRALNSAPPSMPPMRDLFRIAARARRAISILNSGLTNNNSSQYGHSTLTGMDGSNSRLIDYIVKNGTRYKDFYQHIAKGFNALIESIEKGSFQHEFGEEYSAKVERGERYTSVRIYHRDVPHEIAHLKRDPLEDDTISFAHSHAGDQEAMFALADRHMQKILKLSQENPDDMENFWKEMGAISLHLFHAGPLKFGTQTTALIVLAGITKAMGISVMPRNLETDHFIDAELTPYKRYVSEYGGRSGQQPAAQKIAPLPSPLPVNDNFLAEAEEKQRRHYDFVDEPLERMTRYLQNARYVYYFSAKVKVTEMEVIDNKISLKIKPEKDQQCAEAALDFVGHEEVIRILGLSPGKFVDPLVNKRNTGFSQGF